MTKFAYSCTDLEYFIAKYIGVHKGVFFFFPHSDHSVVCIDSVMVVGVLLGLIWSVAEKIMYSLLHIHNVDLCMRLDSFVFFISVN